MLSEIKESVNAYIYRTLIENASINANMNVTPAPIDKNLFLTYRGRLAQSGVKNSDMVSIVDTIKTSTVLGDPTFSSLTSTFAKVDVKYEADDIYSTSVFNVKVLTFDYVKANLAPDLTLTAATNAILNNATMAVFAGRNAVH